MRSAHVPTTQKSLHVTLKLKSFTMENIFINAGKILQHCTTIPVYSFKRSLTSADGPMEKLYLRIEKEFCEGILEIYGLTTSASIHDLITVR